MRNILLSFFILIFSIPAVYSDTNGTDYSEDNIIGAGDTGSTRAANQGGNNSPSGTEYNADNIIGADDSKATNIGNQDTNNNSSGIEYSEDSIIGADNNSATTIGSQGSSGGGGVGVPTRGQLNTTDFTIDVSSISPGGQGLLTSTKAETNIDNTLKRFIERLLIALGTIALLVMTIGAGYIILYGGEDERLTRGKTIFTGGLIAVALALLSGIMVQLVAYLLYI